MKFGPAYLKDFKSIDWIPHILSKLLLGPLQIQQVN